MERIVFLDRATLAPQTRLRAPGFPHSMTEYDRTAPDQVAARARDATIVILNKVRLGAEELRQIPDLKLVAISATGSDCVDKAYCREHGIAVCNIRGYAVHSVPEHVMALTLALRRNLVAYRQDVIDGEWQRARQFCFFNHPIDDLHGKRIGIVGSGALGRATAELARAFGMAPVFAGRKGRSKPAGTYTPWDEVIETSAVISLHCPLLPETRGLIGLPELRRMGRKSLLINTARGGLIDEDALEQALDEGLIGGAGLDVTMPEPPPEDSTIMRLARRPNVIVTPHIAWASDEAQQILADQCIDNIENFVAGHPTNLVTGDY